MRLTLRTLLSYMDDMLETRESQELRQKIESSETANGLVYRIRSATRKLRLAAPKPDAKGIGQDANTVAEYLDNTLDPAQLGDFERLCLESDVHLAEVASCHQILALVLVEAAEVPEAARDRLYRLPQEPSRDEDDSESFNRPLTIQELPEQLKPRRVSPWRPVVATVALTLVLVAVALMLTGPMDQTHPILGPLFANPATVADVVEPAEPSRSAADANPQAVVVAPDDQTSTAATTGEGSPAADPEAADDLELSAESSQPAPSAPAEGTTGTESPQTPATAQPSPAGGEAPDSVEPRPPAPGRPSEVPPQDEPSAGVPLEPPPATPEDPPTAPEPPPAVEAGRFLTVDLPQVVARYAPADQAWLRIAPGTVLEKGDSLLVLPSFRPLIALTSGVQATLIGPTQLRIAEASTEQSPALQIGFGQLLLDTAGIAGARIQLDLVGRRGTLTFAQPDATVAVTVHTVLPPGEDPRTARRRTVAELLVISGAIDWLSPDQDSIRVEAGGALRLASDEVPQVGSFDQPPAWVSAADQRGIAARASRELEPLLGLDRPLGLSLAEQVDNRQVEVSALAVQSLMFVGNFDPLVRSLRDERYHAYWRQHVAVLQQVLTTGPQAGQAVWSAFRRGRSEYADTLYRLCWGYSQEQLEAGSDADLVELLEGQELDVRILTFENLRRITEGKTFVYRPEKRPDQQRKPLQDWNNALRDGEIRYPQ